MNASYDWLRAFVPTDRSAAEVADLLTMRCATVEEIHSLRQDLAPIVVARVVEAERHPNSEHLSVTRVDAGSGELLDVVCGAPNVRAGALYPFAPVGTVMPDGLKIERRKIRGAVSAGMLCSARELGLGSDHEGILELEVDAAPGTPLLDVMPVGDVRLVVDVLPNRPDLLSHIGLAREVAAATNTSMVRPAELGGGEWQSLQSVQGRGELAKDGFTLRVEDEDGCPRYMAAIVRGVKVAPSPDWLVRRLEAVGVRSINNVVDITNYCLHAFGQPMHAFDLARLGDTVVVRAGRPGERLTTLDGQDRAVPDEAVVIADASRPVAFAGIMGGADTEVSGETTDILLEVASFSPKRVRRTRRALGLSTDASQRFERGVDPEVTPLALSEAVALLEKLAGGRLEAEPLDVRAPQQPRSRVSLRVRRVRQLLGVDMGADRCRDLLASIGLETVESSADSLTIQPPSWRADVVDEVDLIEEVARLYGYDTIPSDPEPSRPSTVPDAPLVPLTDRIRRVLAAEGLLEARPLPFVPDPGIPAVRVLNPLAENEAFLRTAVLDTLARRAEYNLARMQRNVRLFEIGPAFRPGAKGERPHEEVRVGLVVLGERRPAHFTEPRPPAYDEWDAKGLAELLLEEVYPSAAARLVPGEGAVLWRIEVDGVERGEVRRVELDAPVWASAAFGVELAIAEDTGVLLHGAGPKSVKFAPLPEFPAAEFDLALLVPESVPAGDVESVMRTSLGELLESLVLFDEFRGGGVPSGKRSLAWRLVLRHPERTLRDKEIEGRRSRLLKSLAQELDVHARS